MARWTRDERLDQPQDFVRFMMEDYLNKGGFKKKIHKGEEVWQEGEGILSSARFIRYEYAGGLFHLEAWIGKCRENALKGFVGALPKKMFRESLAELIRLLHQPLPQAREGEAGRVVTIQVPDHAKYAVPAMVVSIVGIIVGLMLSPLGGILLGSVGISLGQNARNSSKGNIARASVILGTVAVIAAIVGYILNMIFLFSFF